MRLLTIVLLLLSFVGDTHAIQRPKSTHRVSAQVSKKEQRKTERVLSKALSHNSKSKSKAEEVEESTPTTLQIQAKLVKEHNAERVQEKTYLTEEFVCNMPEKVWKKTPTCTGSLPSDEPSSRAFVQQMQLRNRSFVGVRASVQVRCKVFDKVEALACAIAQAEGFYRRGTIPNRYHNAGDLKAVRGWVYPGQRGVGKANHVRFRSDQDGWAALRHQIEMIISGASTHYSVNMSLQEMSKHYAGNHRVWTKNVAHNLGVPQDTYLWEVLDVLPVLEASWRSQ